MAVSEPNAPAIGIDVGGTKLAAGLVDASGRILRRTRAPTPATDPERLVGAIANLIQQLREGMTEPLAGVGLAVPGQFDQDTGRFVRVANLALAGFPFRARLAELTGLSVAVENDTNAAALGEWSEGRGRGHLSFIYLALGTGIGAGVILGGQLLRGARGSAGEIGHTVVEKNGPRCGCGNRGCLELYASGGALARRAARVASEYPDSLLAEWSRAGRELTTGDLFAAADRGDEASRAVVDEACQYLAVGLSNLFELFDPEVVALGGGVSQIGPSLFERLGQAIRAQRPGSPDIVSRIVPAALGEDAGIIGAAAAVRSK